VTTGLFAKERARIAAACPTWTADRMTFQRNRLADRSRSTDEVVAAAAVRMDI
jgi:hypothetical protein